jgi:hypothetical protein
MRALRGGETRSFLRHGMLLWIVAAVGAAAMVAPTSIWAHGGHPANLLEAYRSISPGNGKRPRRAASLPVHRSILAVDIEGSTQRTNPVKGELREEVYRIVTAAVVLAGIDDHYCDPFIDRGDGLLVLLQPADDFPKPFLFSRLIPAMTDLLVAYNGGISAAEQPRIMRLRTVLHAGEVHYDGNGPFGEDLDVAFRLLDAPKFKAHLKKSSADQPLALVASDTIYSSIIRHGYDGIDGAEFVPMLNVNVGLRRRKGWVHLPRAGRFPVAVPAQARAVYAS